jgi:hypothetical protein
LRERFFHLRCVLGEGGRTVYLANISCVLPTSRWHSRNLPMLVQPALDQSVKLTSIGSFVAGGNGCHKRDDARGMGGSTEQADLEPSFWCWRRNHLWIRLQPAIGMLGGSPAASLLIVSSDRVFHTHLMSTGSRDTGCGNPSHVLLDGALAIAL